MNQNPTDFFSAMEKISRENDKALRSLFGKYIKGNFLIEMKHFIMDNLPEIYNYYDMQMSMEKVVAGNELMDFDICRMIVGCHSSNIIFLSDDERVALEKSSDYKRKLALNVEKNIKLRRYGSAYFRRQSIMQGDMYLAHNVPYNVFVMSLRMNEILHFNKKENPYLLLYYSLSNKALATLSLLEDNFLDNCYPICRAIIELYTTGWEICDELKPYVETVIDKITFGSVDLPNIIKDFGKEIEEIELCGLCTDICVISNAMILKATFPEVRLLVDAKCCAGVSVESHNTALDAMRAVQIDIL